MMADSEKLNQLPVFTDWEELNYHLDWHLAKLTSENQKGNYWRAQACILKLTS
jgi:hypothetical protein